MRTLNEKEWAMVAGGMIEGPDSDELLTTDGYNNQSPGDFGDFGGGGGFPDQTSPGPAQAQNLPGVTVTANTGGSATVNFNADGGVSGLNIQCAGGANPSIGIVSGGSNIKGNAFLKRALDISGGIKANGALIGCFSTPPATPHR